MPIIVVSDIDGVVADTNRTTLSWLWDKFRLMVPYEAITKFHIGNCVEEYYRSIGHNSLPGDYIESLIMRSLWRNPEFYSSLLPNTTVCSALQALANTQQILLTFLTSRPHTKKVRRATEDWLFRYGFGHPQVDFVPRSKTKAQVIMEDSKHLSSEDLLIQIDDDARVYQQLKKFKDRDLISIPTIATLMKRPWNAGCHGDGQDSAKKNNEALAATGAVLDDTELLPALSMLCGLYPYRKKSDNNAQDIFSASDMASSQPV